VPPNPIMSRRISNIMDQNQGKVRTKTAHQILIKSIPAIRHAEITSFFGFLFWGFRM
jgi:hypothetical protein